MSPVSHEFRYGLFMLYLDLDELPSLLERRFGLSCSRFSPASFRRKDHIGDPGIPLPDAVRLAVSHCTGQPCQGPIRLLTHLRNFGYFFSPLNLYYCFDGSGENLTCVVAEVCNTPWLEKHWYVLWEGNHIGVPGHLRFRHAKDFHVSPFMSMAAEYEWSINRPGQRLSVSIAYLAEGRRLFDIAMILNREELNRGTMIRTLLRHPWMTARITHAIYYQALRLWLKKCPFYAHPKYAARREARKL